MQALKKQLKHSLAFFLFSSLFLAHSAMAETDLTAQENYLKARAASRQTKTDHADHLKPTDIKEEFHGVFYGFVPCNDCPGIKMTLSLNKNNNYLLVIQYARPGSREIYEKGKYAWNDETHNVVLTPRKGGTTVRHLLIEDENLIQLSNEGARITGADADRHILRRSDSVKSREIHFH